jgi:hypothetical protein
VRAYKDNGESLESRDDYPRRSIVKAIDSDGISFVTAFKGNDGKWKKGEDVFVIEIGGDKYIKTKRDRTTKDNLDNLPEF